MPNYNPGILIMETDVRPVTVGLNTPGWVSGSPLNLAAAGSATCLFDLGTDWDQYTELVVIVSPVGTSSGFSNVSVNGSDTTTLNTARRLPFSNSNTLNSSFTASILTSGGTQSLLVAPVGRYVHVPLTNADGVNPMTTAKVTLAAYPQ